MTDEVTIGIDLAKNVFSVHAVAADGRVLMGARLRQVGQ